MPALFRALRAAAPLALLAVLAAPAPAAAQSRDGKLASDDRSISIVFPHGWQQRPDDMSWMSLHRRDLRLSKGTDAETLRFSVSDVGWRRLERVYNGKRGAETHATPKGLSIILTFAAPNAEGIFRCDQTAYEFSSYKVNYATLMKFLDSIECGGRAPANRPLPRPG